MSSDKKLVKNKVDNKNFMKKANFQESLSGVSKQKLIIRDKISGADKF